MGKLRRLRRKARALADTMPPIGNVLLRNKKNVLVLYLVYITVYRRSAGDRPPLVNGRVWGAKTQSTEKTGSLPHVAG